MTTWIVSTCGFCYTIDSTVNRVSVWHRWQS